MSINLEEKIDYTTRYVGYEKKWLTPLELSIEYQISQSNQSKMRMSSNSSTIPFVKIGRYIRYKRADIDAWLDAHKVQG